MWVKRRGKLKGIRAKQRGVCKLFVLFSMVSFLCVGDLPITETQAKETQSSNTMLLADVGTDDVATFNVNHYHSSCSYHSHTGSCDDWDTSRYNSSGTQSKSCGCTYEKHYWKCNQCGRTNSSTTNSSSKCKEGHSVSDSGSPLKCHKKKICGKSEGYQ